MSLDCLYSCCFLTSVAVALSGLGLACESVRNGFQFGCDTSLVGKRVCLAVPVVNSRGRQRFRIILQPLSDAHLLRLILCHDDDLQMNVSIDRKEIPFSDRFSSIHHQGAFLCICFEGTRALLLTWCADGVRLIKKR